MQLDCPANSSHLSRVGSDQLIGANHAFLIWLVTRFHIGEVLASCANSISYIISDAMMVRYPLPSAAVLYQAMGTISLELAGILSVWLEVSFGYVSYSCLNISRSIQTLLYGANDCCIVRRGIVLTYLNV
jgi:hypothetical protein